MSFFISDAVAEGAAATGSTGDSLMGLIPFVLLFVIFYFFLIRPQSKRVKEHKNMLTTLGKGDEIVTNGGLLGKIIMVGDEFVTVEIANNTQVKLQKQYIANLMPKGTIKSAE
ncbi:MAG: preprotein translocase subunit YajC [Gammaproteobacteria bacterium]|nr:preprotein translocase subunit YajC [Gammaproteobacteria bacterium]MCF6229549.1 preprotein translocase subunit YajC [Gammaproteobacteria bacterium]